MFSGLIHDVVFYDMLYVINIGKAGNFSNYNLDERIESLRFECVYGKLVNVSKLQLTIQIS